MSGTLDPTETTPETRAAPTAVPVDASRATDRDSWLAAIGAIAEAEGYLETLGARHLAFFVDDGTSLLVSFETIEQARARDGQLPLAHDIAAARGWSHLCIIADGETWYRDPAVYGYFDRLVDDAFFDRFDSVLFFGSGMAGYAACAFSVTAPGSNVLALNPRATLDPAEAGWDSRNRAARRLDFTDRYGYAPDMLEGAGHAVVIHDPTIPAEAMHAALFRAPFITRLSARHMGERIEWALINMAQLQDLIGAAMEGRLDQHLFARAWRNRRNFAPYLRALLAKANGANRVGLEAMICASVSRRLGAPKFAKRLTELRSDQP